MNKQVRISEEVLSFLASKSQGFETVDQVLRRLFKIKQKEKSVKQ